MTIGTVSFHNSQINLFTSKLNDLQAQEILEKLPPEQKSRLRIIQQEFEFLKVLICLSELI